jgi:gluconate 2-dehydrogenase gamma chain
VYSTELPMDRRALLRNAILLVGGSMAGLPGEALAQASKQAKARFFTPAQFAVLDETAEIIIPKTDTPGARGAGVPSIIDDLMANWASAERGASFRALMDDIDRAARAEGAASLRALPPARRLDLVRRYDAEKIGAKDPVYGRFKELVLTTYYLSEAGATQELRYELVPGKWESWTTIGPDARAWAV